MVYGAMLGQHVVHQSNTPDQLIERRQTNLDDAFDLVRNYGARAANLKLGVFPEFFLTGPVSPLGHKLGHISDKIGVTFPGPEMDQIAAFAQEICAYVSGGVVCLNMMQNGQTDFSTQPSFTIRPGT